MSEVVSGQSIESDNSSDEENEKLVDAKIQKLILESEANPYQYDKHVELITALRATGDLDQLRVAREGMSTIYPLSEELWLEWFQDELPLAVIPEQKEFLLSKFELAVKDYSSTKVWNEYCQFVMNNIESPADIERARNVFERAIVAVGLHVTEGASIWDGYREFEIAILDSYQQLQDSGDTVGMDSKVQSQIERIVSIFRRQLSIPLLGMDNTFKTYEDWAPEPVQEQTRRAYEKAAEKLSLSMEYEEKLHDAAGSKLNEYKQYIEFELKGGDPARIQCIFERAIKDNCLQHDLWINYTNYLDYKLKIPNVSVPVHERAVRNCPWISQLWINYFKALERNNEDYIKVKEIFNNSLKGGFANAEDYLKVWLANADYHRRRITDWNLESESVEELHKAFEGAITYMNHYFGLEGDKNCLLLREWAFIEAKYLMNIKRAQELWDTVMKKHSRDSNMWLEYVQFIMLFGDVLTVRRIFQRCIQISLDDPESICDAFIRFERQYGTLEDVDDSTQKVESQLKRLKERKEKEMLKELSISKNDKKKRHGNKHETDEKNLDKKKKKKKSIEMKPSNKRSINEKINEEQPQAKKTKGNDTTALSANLQMPDDKEEQVRNEGSIETKTMEWQHSNGKQRQSEENEDTIKKNMKSVNERLQEMSSNDGVDKVDNERSVFLSNLLFTVDEQNIRSFFDECGAINTIRIIVNRAGKSKGYAYVQFDEKESVQKALSKDRMNLNGRPAFVSECVDKKENPTKFKFPTTIDKHTLYVSNIAFELNEDDIKTLFQQVGPVKQVRLVTNRSGKSKGYAYIEYENETDAKSGILKFDKHILHGRPMNVAISNPPARKDPEKQQEKQQQHPSKQTDKNEGRGKSRTQISLLPRAVQKPSSSSSTSSSETSQQTGTKTNDDFRKLLLKK